MGRKKPRKPRNGRASEQCITRRGLRIHQKGDQIKTLTGHRWDVASQSEEGVWYRVSFAGDSPTCECAYHTTGKGCRCKHIAAVEHTLLISSDATFGKKVDVKEKESVLPRVQEEEVRPRRMAPRQAREEAEVQVYPYADGGSGTIWVLSTARCRACTSRWP